MTSIKKAQSEDISLLAQLGSITFIESHGSSAAKEDIDNFVNENFTEEAFKEELFFGFALKNIINSIGYL